ncbi:MAG TPA: hypothetical protein ENL02_01715 [Epsilonproteobacteria bacterium]|nr:hypothetical protein [Campylobacterota bacterium]
MKKIAAVSLIAAGLLFVGCVEEKKAPESTAAATETSTAAEASATDAASATVEKAKVATEDATAPQTEAKE